VTTLAIRMRPSGKLLGAPVLAISVLAGLSVAAAQAAEPANPAAKKYVVPRTEFGAPDLRGVWNYSSDTPFERPPQYKDREFLTPEEAASVHRQLVERSEAIEKSGVGVSADATGGYNQFWMDFLAQDTNLRTSLLIDPPDGRMPPVKPGVKVENGGLGPDTGGVRPVRFRVGGISKDGPEDRGLSERCLMGYSSGPPALPSLYNNILQIFQTKTHAVIMTEMIHDARIVPLDNRPPLDPAITQWSGDSRGRWEGNTLVVETRNFTDKTTSFRGAGTAKDLHLTERFTRIGPNRVDYQFTIDDPTTFAKPFTALVPMVRAEGDLYEYACHEGNYGLANILSGQRKEERDVAAKKAGSAQ
jgi:hypothetical protein